jgi:hypothetical protein
MRVRTHEYLANRDRENLTLLNKDRRSYGVLKDDRSVDLGSRLACSD